MGGDISPPNGQEPPSEPPNEPPTEPGNAPSSAPPSAPAPSDTHTNAGGAGSGGSDRLDAIERTVAGLVDIVAGLAPKDDRPTKLPWTHRGSARRGED
jgi:hypothetical protein